jgi:ABC-2 type transport system permease protein
MVKMPSSLEATAEARPRARPQPIGLRQWFDEIVAYSELLTNLVARDLKTKYRGSLFGIFWSLLNPLLLMLVYSLVFSLIVRVNIHPYPVFLLAGLVPWNAFAQSLISATMSVIDSAGIVRKVYFPLQLLPLSAVVSASVNFVISLALLAVLKAFLDPHIGVSIVLLPVLVLLQIVFTYGIGAILAAIEVYFRDVQYFLGVLLTAWFFVTPVVYSIDLVPHRLRPFMLINPMAWDISSFQAVWFNDRFPSPVLLALFAAASGLSLVLGVVIYGRLSRRFAEEV